MKTYYTLLSLVLSMLMIAISILFIVLLVEKQKLGFSQLFASLLMLSGSLAIALISLNEMILTAKKRRAK